MSGPLCSREPPIGRRARRPCPGSGPDESERAARQREGGRQLVSRIPAPEPANRKRAAGRFIRVTWKHSQFTSGQRTHFAQAAAAATTQRACENNNGILACDCHSVVVEFVWLLFSLRNVAPSSAHVRGRQIKTERDYQWSNQASDTNTHRREHEDNGPSALD